MIACRWLPRKVSGDFLAQNLLLVLRAVWSSCRAGSFEVDVFTRILKLARFNTVERWILTELLGQVKGSFHDKVSAQIDSVNLVQRHNNGMEVYMYSMRFGKLYRDPKICFKDSSYEIEFARVTIKLAGVRNRVRFFSGQGYFGSMDFDQPFQRNLRLRDCAVSGTWTILDLDLECRHETSLAAQSGISDSTDYVNPILLKNGLDEWMSRRGMVYSWLDAKDRREVCVFEQWYLLIAEVPGEGMVGVRRGEIKPICYYLDYSEKIPVAI